MNAKTSKPDRKDGRRRDRRSEPKEFEETTLSIDRVTRVVKGGRRMRFRAIVVVGNKKGKVGLGTGKAGEVQAAVQKATRAAKRAMMRVPINKGTIPHQVDMKYKSAKLRILPASAGTGIIAGGALRVILELAGVKDVLSKRFGTKNKLVNAQAAMLALKALKPVRGYAVSEVAAKPVDIDTEEESMSKSAPAIKEISKKEAEERSKGHNE